VVLVAPFAGLVGYGTSGKFERFPEATDTLLMNRFHVPLGIPFVTVTSASTVYGNEPEVLLVPVAKAMTDGLTEFGKLKQRLKAHVPGPIRPVAIAENEGLSLPKPEPGTSSASTFAGANASITKPGAVMGAPTA